MDKLASLVPGIYYDLIGRVVPGAALCAVLAANTGIDLASLQSLGLLHVLALLSSYTLGFVLDMLSGALLKWPNHGIFRLFGRFSDVWRIQVWEAIAAETDGPHAAKLTKMMAERAMLRSFLVLSVFLWILEPWPIVNLSTLTKVALAIVIALVYYRMEFSVRLAARTVSRLNR